MEVIAAILAAMASLRQNIVMPILAWRLCKMASENRQSVEIDVERLTGAVHIRFDGRSAGGSIPILGVEVEGGKVVTSNEREAPSAPTPKELANFSKQTRQTKHPRGTKGKGKQGKRNRSKG
jgi:hypothetical protein